MAEVQAEAEAANTMDRAMALAGQRCDQVAHLTHRVISQHSSLDLLKFILHEKVVADTSSYLNYFVQTKVFLYRHPSILFSLRLMGCCYSIPFYSGSMDWSLHYQRPSWDKTLQ